MLLLAIFGVLVNGAAVLRLKKGSSLNEKVVSLHLIEDVFGWAVILTGSVVMTFVYLPVLDPVLSVLITLYVLFNVFKNLKTSIPIFLQAVPNHTNIELIKEKILQMPGITGVHDIHTWTLDGEYNILSIHLILKEVDNLTLIQSIKEQVRHLLTGMEIHHITIETEREDDDCHLRDCPG